VPRIEGPNKEEEGLSSRPMPIGIAQEHETKKRAVVRARMDDSGRITPSGFEEQGVIEYKCMC
jgi:hypothetical protein